MPDDYYDFVLFVPFLSNGLPNDKYHIISLSAVKNFLFNTKYLRAGIEFGPSVVIGQIAYYTPVIDPVPFLGSNYEMERANKVVAGISARGKLECPALSVVGIELALFTNINRFNSFIGGDFCINLGLVR
jgi:hypothetical protein